MKITPGPKATDKDDSDTSLEINAADIPELDDSDTSLEINAADIPELDDSDTSLEINADDIPELKKEQTLKDNKSMEDTDDFDDEDIQMIASAKTEKDSLEYSYHETESEEEDKSNSIMNLLNKKEVSEDDIDTTETELSDTLSGKSLDDILKTSQKSEDDWHESKNESIADKKEVQDKHKKLKIILAASIAIIITAAVVMNIVKGKLNTPDQDQTIKSVSFDKLVIPANLKDEKKLKSYFSMAENLYKGKKYAKAELILKKLLRTGWNTSLINGMLGECRNQQKDEKGAVDFYRKALQSGYTEKLDFALSLGKILTKEKNFSEVISSLEPFKEKYASNQGMQLLLAVAYYEKGMINEALECYKLMNPSLLPEKQLEEYAKLLEEKGEKQAAFKIYLTLGKIYNNTQAYIKAEKLAPDEKSSMSILAQIVGKTTNTPKGTYYKMRFGIKMFKSGKEKEGLQIIRGVNTDKLNKKDAIEYLSMLPHFEGDNFLIQEAFAVLTKYYSEDIDIHEKLKENLIKDGKSEFCHDFFKKEFLTFPKNPVANYMYAGFQSDPKMKVKLYKNAIELSPTLYEAALALGIFYINEQKLERSSNTFTKVRKVTSKIN